MVERPPSPPAVARRGPEHQRHAPRALPLGRQDAAEGPSAAGREESAARQSHHRATSEAARVPSQAPYAAPATGGQGNRARGRRPRPGTSPICGEASGTPDHATLFRRPRHDVCVDSVRISSPETPAGPRARADRGHRHSYAGPCPRLARQAAHPEGAGRTSHAGLCSGLEGETASRTGGGGGS